ncbi:MAG: beta strand repeat-containing protein [Thermomicrobiales bacterium]
MASKKGTQLPVASTVADADSVIIVTATTPTTKRATKAALLSGLATQQALTSHTTDTANPHAVTKTQVGLVNVPNVDATVRANHTGTQTASTISDFSTVVSANADVVGNTAARHTHANKTVLDAITASYTTAEASKLAGVATGATANDTDTNLKNRANHTGTQSADTLTDGTTNKAFLATERTKLAGVAMGADVTQAAVAGAAVKTTPVDADTIPLSDSAASNALKKMSWSNLKTTLKVYLDTLYASISDLNDRAFKTTVTVGPTGSKADYICDGVADQVEMQTAIDAVLSAGGGRVLIKYGNYELSSYLELKSNVRVIGEGSSTVLKMTNGVNVDEFIRANAITRGSLENLMVDYNHQNNPTPERGMRIVAPSMHVTVKDCIFSHPKGFAIGFFGAGTGDVSIRNTHSRVINNFITNILPSNSDICLVLSDSGLVHSNTIEGASQNGSLVLYESDYLIATDNHISLAAETGVGIGIWSMRHGLVANNIVIGSGTTGTIAVSVFTEHDNASPTASFNNLIANNQIRNVNTAFAVFDSTDDMFSNNKVDTVAKMVDYPGPYQAIRPNFYFNRYKNVTVPVVVGLAPDSPTYVGNANASTDSFGIGTLSPAAQLHVVRDSAVSPATAKVQNIDGTGAGEAQLFLGTSATLSNETVGASLYADRTNTGGAGSTDLLLKNSNGSTLNTNVTIKHDGKVGIGKTPASLLDVNGAISTSLATKTGAYTLTTTNSVILADATSGGFTLTLPTAVGIDGRQYTIKRINSAANNVTLGTTSSQTIDGSTTKVLTSQYQQIVVVSDGSNWQIVANGLASSIVSAWGGITGTLLSQTDLQTALNAKSPLASPTFTGTVTTPKIALSGPNTDVLTLGSVSALSAGLTARRQALIADNLDGVSGVQMENTSTGVSADFRFLLRDTGDHYVAFSQPGTGNTGTLFGAPRSTLDLLFSNGGTGRTLAIGTAQAQPIIFGTTNAERVRILSGGNLLIGTTSDNSKLTVAGPIATALATKTAAYTLTATDSIILADATTAAFQATLPTAVGITGRQYTVKRINGGANNVTVGTTSGQTIDGVTTFVLTTQYQYIRVVSDGTNWFVT